MPVSRRSLLACCTAIFASLFTGMPLQRPQKTIGKLPASDHLSPDSPVRSFTQTRAQPHARELASIPQEAEFSPHRDEKIAQHSVPAERELHRHVDLAIRDNLAELPHTSQAVQTPATDIVLDTGKQRLMRESHARLSRLQKYIGHGNFNVISWDDSLKYAHSASEIGSFSTAELDFIDELFSTNAVAMGFYGDKLITHLSEKINRQKIKKIPGTGHYLFKGEAIDTYSKIRRDIGSSVVLTSGIRGVVKQIYLFLNKAIEVNGNLSLASYSLAPPGHSYHAVGDFDVGKVGFGKDNFTDAFSQTEEFKRLTDLGYFDIRYPQNNPFGVRYEPWHIKVV